MRKLSLEKIKIAKLNNLQSMKIMGGTGDGDPDDPSKSVVQSPMCDPPDRTDGDGTTQGDI